MSGKYVKAFIRSKKSRKKYETPYEKEYFAPQFRRHQERRIFTNEGELHIRLERRDKDRFVYLLHQQGKPVSEFCREFILEWLAEHDQA